MRFHNSNKSQKYSNRWITHRKRVIKKRYYLEIPPIENGFILSDAKPGDSLKQSDYEQLRFSLNKYLKV